MKKYISLFFITTTLALTQCFEQKERIVSYENQEEIQKKLHELRDKQADLNKSNVNSDNYLIDIENKIEELNDLIAPGNIPITYSIGIVSAAGNQEDIGVSGAVVSINVRDQRLTATTDTDGQVVFENLRSGIVLVHIAVPGFTDASFVADLRVTPDDDYTPGNSGNPYNVTSAIALYPTTGGNGAATVSGNLYFDNDRSNDVLDPASPEYGRVGYFNFNGSTAADVYPFRPAERIDLQDNVEVGRSKPLLDAREQTWAPLNRVVKLRAFVQPNTSDFSYVPAGTAGNIVLALYEEMFITVNASAVGAYTLTIPAGVNSNTVNVTLEEFAGVERYIRATNLNTLTGLPSITTRDRNVVYTPLYAYIGNSANFPGGFNGSYYDFFASDINRYQFSMTERRVRKVDFYFGARTRDE